MPSRPSPAAPARPREREKGWMQAVIEAAQALRWEAYHTHRSEHSPAGFPDLVLIREAERIGEPSTIIVAELKTERGVVSADQQRWLDLFASAGVPAFVWRPSDWPEVEKVLKEA